MASAKQKNTQGDGDNDDKDNDSGLVDFNATDVKKVLKRAQKRGFITHDEINALLPNDEMTSDQIEDVMSQISEMGIAVVETEEEAEEQGKALTKIEDRKVVAKKGNARGSDRTDDPVRMYLREMGAVELLSREGEIAIAKRIEAGRDAMIRGLCESPLTFEAMMVWRDELINERILLRDLIDLEATYGAENPPPEPKPVEKEEEPEAKAKTRRGEVDEVEAERERQQKEAEEEEDEDDAAAMSMSAMEAELRDGVLAKLDEIADGFGRYRKLQDKLVSRRMEGKELTPKAQSEYDELSNNIVENLKTIHINNARIEALVEQLYAINKKLMGLEGKLMRLADAHGVPRKEFLSNYFGRELEPDWTEKVKGISAKWKRFVESKEGDIEEVRAEISEIAQEIDYLPG